MPARGMFVGLATVDLIHRVDHPVGPNDKVTALSQEIVAGGPAANAAITFALLGGHAVLVTDLGAHPLAVLARHDLESFGVQVRAVDPDSPEMPAVSSIRVLDGTGDRSVVSVNAATRTVVPPPWLPAALDGADVLLLDGHHPLVAVAAARAARERDVPVVLDAGSWKPVLAELLPLVEIAICSADFRIPGTADVSGVLLAAGVGRVSISRGGEPMPWWSTDLRDVRAGATASGSVQVPKVRVRDTLGAGDVLHGAFAWRLATRRDAPFQSLLAAAAAVATDRCTHVGISSWRNHARKRRGR